MFAEIADKMSTVPELWSGWLIASLVFVFFTVAATILNRWFGLLPVVLATASAIVLYRPDLEYFTIVELGYTYLAHHYITACLPAIASSFAWLAAAHFWWHKEESRLPATKVPAQNA